MMSGSRRDQVMVGDLPVDFLRIASRGTAQEQQISADEQAALLLQQQLCGGGSGSSPTSAATASAFYPGNVAGRLNVTVVEARLNKNYGMTRMDPYCRIRVGHSVYETHTDHNGAKNPRWNKAISCYLPHGVNSFYLEIFDECAFTMDERVAWAYVSISDNVFNGDTVDDWFELSGKLGEGQEGSINLVLSYVTLPSQPMLYPTVPGNPVMMAPVPVFGMPVYATGVAPPPPSNLPAYTEDDVKQVEEVFPTVDKDVIRSLFDANRGDKTAVINNLLQMNE